VKQIGTLLLLGFLFLAACATLRQVEQGELRQKPASQGAVVANRELRPGMSAREVKAILGEPDDLMIYSGDGAPERWKYYHYPDCAPHPGTSAPTTELVFVNGRLQKWLRYKKPPKDDSRNK